MLMYPYAGFVLPGFDQVAPDAWVNEERIAVRPFFLGLAAKRQPPGARHERRRESAPFRGRGSQFPFPQHPLTRVREVLAQLSEQVSWHPDFILLLPFTR